MRRLPARRNAGGVTLFPFLAVLLCTMGTLILVLVVITRQARLQALQAAAPAADPNHDDARTRLEDLEWRIARLHESRDKTAAQLADQRRELSHLEDHARRLRDNLAELEAAHDQLNKTAASGGHERQRLLGQLAGLEHQIAEAQQELEQAAGRVQPQAPSFAVVPYQGKNATRRRPIYIECTSDAIVFQPEGIELVEEDFAGSLGPSNPLAAGLRAAREYLAESGRLGPSEAEEPYPLLLVRPGGIKAYYAARAAMTSWGSEFGYEMVDEEWSLAFPPPDPELARALRKAVEDARRRQALLALSAPRRMRAHQRPLFRATPTKGGIMRDGRDQTYSAGQDDLAPSSDRGAPAVREPSGPSQQGQSGSIGSSKAASLARTRGENWGLPDAARGAVPITRPVHIVCDADHLTLVSDSRDGRGVKVIALGPRTEDCLAELVSSVWERIDAWGIAGNGMYWRPVLSMEIVPGGEGRYRDLEALLAGSGLAVQEKPASQSATRYPRTATPY